MVSALTDAADRDAYDEISTEKKRMKATGTAAEPNEDIKTKLRKLRDRLALEAPRARARPSTPPDLIRRLQAAAEQVSSVYLLSVAPGAAESGPLLDAQEDAIAEAHLTLIDWERCVERASEAKPAPRQSGINRREHERLRTAVSVNLLRHSVHQRGDGALLLDSASTIRSARNLSLGGIFVSVAKDELPEITVGKVVHISVKPSNAAQSFELRAAVARRDDTGVGLRWLFDSDRERRVLDALLDAIRAAK